MDLKHILIGLLFITLSSFSQCPEADTCTGAINISEDTEYYFCNTDCEDDFDSSGMSNIVGPFNFTCHFLDYDFWLEFTYPLDATGFLCLAIWDGTCNIDPVSIGNYGPLEGWVMQLWEGTTCEEATLIWSTNCYWMTEQVPGVIGPTNWVGINAYDPTRQAWYIEIDNAIPGQHYFIQIDSFNICRGCGYFKWCAERMFLNLPIENILVPLLEETIEPESFKITDLRHREVFYLEPYILYLYHYADGTVKKKIIIP
jgi:hypothetical protein